ncbi:MAG: phosphohexomutase domain-containing protein [Nitrososphaerales archaeon]
MSQVDRVTGLVVPQIKVKFGTAGIRGVYGEEVSIRETIAVCYAVHQLLGEGRFGIGYDSRKTSVILATVAASAMNWYGSEVESYGMIPTPVLAFNIKNSKLHAGFSVTASHNPPEYAGVKVFGTDGIEFSLEAEQKLEQLVLKSEGYTKKDEELGIFGSTFENEEAIVSYMDALLKQFEPRRKRFKILVDCANGTAGGITPRILSELGHHVVTVNAHPSERFPGRLPEPMFETLGEVASLTRAIGADFTIAHDGDADRLVMIDDLGMVVPDYALSTLVLKIIVEKVKKGNVIISVNSSSALEKTALDLGCRIQRSRLGKTFEELYKRRGIFGSEPSKMVDPRWGYWEDGIYTSILVAQYLAENNLTLSQAISGTPVYYNLQKNLRLGSFLDHDCVKSMIKEKFRREIERFDEIDGIKVYLKGGAWLMVRSSGTEKKVRVYVESPQEGEAALLLQDGVNIASSCSK